MRVTIVALLVVFSSISLFSQQSGVNTLEGIATSADVEALIAKAKKERKEGQATIVQPLLKLAPYTVNIEYRVAVANATLHEKEAELFYVIDGNATFVTGGKLVDEKRTNPENRNGTSIEGGTSKRVSKGDVMMVPENTPHWFGAIEGSITLMSMHVPRGK